MDIPCPSIHWHPMLRRPKIGHPLFSIQHPRASVDASNELVVVLLQVSSKPLVVVVVLLQVSSKPLVVAGTKKLAVTLSSSIVVVVVTAVLKS